MSNYRAKQLRIRRREEKVCVAWTEAEYEGLRAGVAAGEATTEIAKRLPQRTLAAVQHHRGAMTGFVPRAVERWTGAEEDELRAGVAAGETSEEIAKRLPGRTLAAVQYHRRAMREGDRRVVERWTEAEEAELRAGVAAGETSEEIAKRLPERTLAAVQHRRRAMEEFDRRVVERWTEAEDAALREGFAAGKSWKEVAEGLPGRTKDAVRRRGAGEFGLKRHGPDAAA
jgi:uncharacterized protein YabN with tetrapyrrole methylase and pyrophosphatase domain